MKAYHVLREGTVWQVQLTDGNAIIQSADRHQLVTWARELARHRGMQLFVCDAAGRLEVIYTYVGGVESAHREIMPPLSAD